MNLEKHSHTNMSHKFIAFVYSVQLIVEIIYYFNVFLSARKEWVVASLATVGTGQDGASWACSIALAGVLINHLACVMCGDSNSPFLP